MPSETRAFWSSNGRRWTAAAVLAGLVVLVAVLVVTGLGASEASVDESPPATVEVIGTSGLSRVTLTARAVERLGVATEEVRNEPAGGAGRQLVPYSAVVYDADGASWVYTQVTDLSFVRHAITVVDLRGDDAVLSSGPGVGTRVVSVGAEELFGTEFEFDED